MKPMEQQSGCRVPDIFLPNLEDVPGRGSKTQQGRKPWKRQDIAEHWDIAVPSQHRGAQSQLLLSWECRGVETGVPVLLS